jgi:hypothetical protein
MTPLREENTTATTQKPSSSLGRVKDRGPRDHRFHREEDDDRLALPGTAALLQAGGRHLGELVDTGAVPWPAEREAMLAA